jgi:hypothetical protein
VIKITAGDRGLSFTSAQGQHGSPQLRVDLDGAKSALAITASLVNFHPEPCSASRSTPTKARSPSAKTATPAPPPPAAPGQIHQARDQADRCQPNPADRLTAGHRRPQTATPGTARQLARRTSRARDDFGSLGLAQLSMVAVASGFGLGVERSRCPWSCPLGDPWVRAVALAPWSASAELRAGRVRLLARDQRMPTPSD